MGHCHAKQKMFRSVGLKMDEKQSVTFALFFSIFLNPQRVTLTYSAMTDGPIDVQLRWANLRAREHHVKGPKKSPRKMVLRRLILRKVEGEKRTATFSVKRGRSM